MASPAARHTRVIVHPDGAARRPAGRVGIVAVIVLCAAAYVLGALIFGGK